MESQKGVENSRRKENMNDFLWFIVLKTQLAFFPVSRNLQVIPDYL